MGKGIQNINNVVTSPGLKFSRDAYRCNIVEDIIINTEKRDQVKYFITLKMKSVKQSNNKKQKRNISIHNYLYLFYFTYLS